jgi:hypothetical protein
MVLNDPNAGNARSVGYLFIGLGLCCATELLVSQLIYPVKSLAMGDVLGLGCLLVLCVNGIVLLRCSPYIQRIEERRHYAAQGNLQRVSLAAHQPLPTEAVLPLPTTIRLRPRWGLVLVMALSLLLCFLLLFTLTFPSAPYNTLLIPLLSLLLAGVFDALLLLIGAQRVEVTEEGLRVWHMLQQAHERQVMRWEHMRLFAIRPANLLSKDREHPGVFELSSPTGIVRWGRVHRRRTAFPFLLYRPRTPFETYDRQMEALLSLIAARTGLPLYDLR